VSAEAESELSRPSAADRNAWPLKAGHAPAAPAAADTPPDRRSAASPPAEKPAESAAPDEATAQGEPAAEQGGSPVRKAARGKRSSVPSWDEIMFGSSRQRD
jgi:hypothetical protein